MPERCWVRKNRVKKKKGLESHSLIGSDLEHNLQAYIASGWPSYLQLKWNTAIASDVIIPKY